MVVSALHMAGMNSPVTVLQRSPCHGPPLIVPWRCVCFKVHTHGRCISAAIIASVIAIVAAAATAVVLVVVVAGVVGLVDAIVVIVVVKES